MKISLLTFLSLLFLLGNIAFTQEGRQGGGLVPKSSSIQDEEDQAVQVPFWDTRLMEIGSSGDTVLFADPVGDGGMDSFGKFAGPYVDLDPTLGVLDYNCGTSTYNGHCGTDCGILSFWHMDEGVPVLAAAPGVVYWTHDGEFDRHTDVVPGATSNAVRVIHSDGSRAGYLHLRKNSVMVEIGDTVAVGDTLGYIGSSGLSTGPHLHFEIVQFGTVIDPFHGPCQTEPSRWTDQPEYVLDLPFALMDHGLTTMPLSWPMICERPPTKAHVTAPGPIYSWIRLLNVLGGDVLTWEFYANGSLWNSHSFTIGGTGIINDTWWYIVWYLPTSTGYFGNWTLEIYRNSDLIAEQNFAYDNQENQLPTIENLIFDVQSGSTFLGEFKASDPDGSIFWYEILSYPANGTLTQHGGRKRKFTYTPNPGFAGQDTVVFYSMDDENAPGENGFYVFNVFIPNHPPECSINPAGPFVITEGDPISFTVTGTDPDIGEIITISGEGIPAGATMTPSLPYTGTTPHSTTFNWTTGPGDAGSYAVKFLVQDDEELACTCNVQITVKPNAPPVCNITPSGPISVYERESIYFVITGTDPDAGNIVTVSRLSNIPPRATMSPRLPVSGPSPQSSSFSWTTGPADSGNYRVSFMISDNRGLSVTCEIVIEVKEQTAVPSMPPWGLMVLILIIAGLFGFMIMRKKRVITR